MRNRLAAGVVDLVDMAGGGAPNPQDNSQKKSVDASLNLVPFIDLLSVLISFLLATAVWTQVAKIDVKHEPTACCGEPSEPYEGPKLAVSIKAAGYTVHWKGVAEEIPSRDGVHDIGALRRVVRRIAAEQPTKFPVKLTSDDAVPYHALIGVMDVCIANGLDGITVGGVDS